MFFFSNKCAGCSQRDRLLAENAPVDVLALDLDGTIQSGSRPIDPEVSRYLRLVKRSGIRLVLVTGRSLPELRRLADTTLFDAVVAENGAILLVGGSQVILAPSGWNSVRKRLLGRFRAGKEQVIISLSRRREKDVRQYLGTSARLEFNKDRLMIMPAKVDKGSGLLAALTMLNALDGRLMCIGDGENDLAMFRIADLKVAVGDSSAALKRGADFVTRQNNGKGAIEAIRTFIGNGQ